MENKFVMGNIEISLNSFGHLPYSIPVAFILLVSREWFVHFVLFSTIKIGDSFYQKENFNILNSIDLFAFGTLSLYGISWGGLLHIQKGKIKIIEFIVAQLWLIIIMVVSVLFLKNKEFQPGSYSDLFFKELFCQAWAVHILNYIPFPPFDVIAVTNLLLGRLILVAKIIFFIALMNGVSDLTFINGLLAMDWFGLKI